jgi:hypothetical protein
MTFSPSWSGWSARVRIITREGSYDVGPCLLIGLDFRGLPAVPVAISEGEFVNGGWYDNVPLHPSFDQARVAHDRG